MPAKSTGHHHAQRLFSLHNTPCDGGCGRPATDRHHIDGNPNHNAPENVRRYCASCHRKAHLTKDVCSRGHPLTPENLIPHKAGWRECRICRNANRRAARARGAPY